MRRRFRVDAILQPGRQTRFIPLRLAHPLLRTPLHLVNRIAVAGDVRGHVGGRLGFGVAEGAGLGGDAGVFLANGGEPGFGGLQGERVIPDRQDDIEVQGAAGGALGPDIVDMDGGLRGHA